MRYRTSCELRKLTETVRLYRKGELRLVTENGDYTPEGSLLLDLFTRLKLIDREHVENLLSHRFLAEQKLASSVLKKFAGTYKLPPEIQALTKVDLSVVLREPEDILRAFPLLSNYFKRMHGDIRKINFVKFFDHVKLNAETHPELLENKALYEAAFATLANYRLSVLLEQCKLENHLADSFSKLKKFVMRNAREEVEAYSGKVLDLQRDSAKAFKGGRRREFFAKRGEELTDLLKESSAYNRVNLRGVTIHGVDNFITALPYVQLKDQGVISQVDANKIVTMDNPSTPVRYEAVMSEHLTKRYVYEAAVESTKEFRKVTKEAVGMNLSLLNTL